MKKHTEPSPQESELVRRNAVDEELKVIYGEGEEQTDLTKLESRPRNRFTRILVWALVTLTVLSIAAWVGFLFFNKVASRDAKSLEVTIEGPDEVVSGREVTFDIVYENRGDLPIATFELKANLPAGFMVTTSAPAPTGEPYVWTIGSVTPGSDGLIRLTGVWIDPVPSGQNMQVISTYRPANFNADFQDIVTKAIAVRSSALVLTVEAPETAIPGEPTTYRLHVKNEEGVDLRDLRLRLNLPTGFLLDTSTPPLPEAGSEWVIAELLRDASTEASVTGTFAADASGLQMIGGAIGIMRNGIFVEQMHADGQTDVIGGGLDVRLIVNGSTDSQTADLNDTLRLSIDITNNGGEEMGGLSVSLAAAGVEGSAPIDWANADLAGGTRVGGTITWSGAALSGQGTLTGGARETIDLSLPLLPELGGNADAFTLMVEASVSSVAGTPTSRTLQNTPITISINSNTTLATAAHYYVEEAVVGTGPLPPTVGETTTYRVYWTIENSLHAIDDAILTATLPPHVTYTETDAADIGTIGFDPSTGLVTWTIERLPTTVASVTATFDVAITPTTDDVGKFVKLTNESLLVATDDETQARLQLSGPELTTELNDPEAAGKGVVIEE